MELSREEYRRAMELVEAVSSAAGADVQIFIEMHGRFSISQAIETHTPGSFPAPFLLSACRPVSPPFCQYSPNMPFPPMPAPINVLRWERDGEILRI